MLRFVLLMTAGIILSTDCAILQGIPKNDLNFNGEEIHEELEAAAVKALGLAAKAAQSIEADPVASFEIRQKRQAQVQRAKDVLDFEEVKAAAVKAAQAAEDDSKLAIKAKTAAEQSAALGGGKDGLNEPAAERVEEELIELEKSPLKPASVNAPASDAVQLEKETEDDIEIEEPERVVLKPGILGSAKDLESKDYMDSPVGEQVKDANKIVSSQNSAGATKGGEAASPGSKAEAASSGNKAEAASPGSKAEAVSPGGKNPLTADKLDKMIDLMNSLNKFFSSIIDNYSGKTDKDKKSDVNIDYGEEEGEEPEEKEGKESEDETEDAKDGEKSVGKSVKDKAKAVKKGKNRSGAKKKGGKKSAAGAKAAKTEEAKTTTSA